MLIKKMIGLSLLSLLMTSCTTVDDYLLGKDNTPKPTTLAPLKTSAHLKREWSVPVNVSKKGTANLKLKPSVVGHTIYIADANGTVSAVKDKTGTVIWTKKLAMSLISGPVVGEGFIIVSTDNSSLIALEQHSGQERWHANVSGDVLGVPVISHGKVIAKTIDGNLYAFDVKTGEKRWMSDHGAPHLILKASSSPVVVKDMILVGYSDGKLDAVSVETGQVLWTRSIAYASGASDVERLVDIDADPIVEGDHVYLATYQGYIGALSLERSDFIWRKQASTYTNILSRGNALYMVDSEGIIWSINKKNGQVNWKQTALKARGLTEPVFVGQYLALGDKTGMLHLLSANTGELVAREQLGGPITVAPIVTAQALDVISGNGQLARFAIS